MSLPAMIFQSGWSIRLRPLLRKFSYCPMEDTMLWSLMQEEDTADGTIWRLHGGGKIPPVIIGAIFATYVTLGIIFSGHRPTNPPCKRARIMRLSFPREGPNFAGMIFRWKHTLKLRCHPKMTLN